MVIIDSQNTLFWIRNLPFDTEPSYAYAMDKANLFDCVLSMSNMETIRNKKQYKCMSSGESVVSTGAVSSGKVTMKMPYAFISDYAQNSLNHAFTTNDGIAIGMELSNDGGLGGTRFVFNARVSSYNQTIEKDSAVLITYTIEIASEVWELNP